MPTKPNAKAVESLKTNEKKWSKPLMDAGWTALPSVIVENQRQLDLSPLDMNIILYLASKWWKAEGKPYPSKSTMAKAMGVHPRTIQKHIAQDFSGSLLGLAVNMRRPSFRPDFCSIFKPWHRDHPGDA